MTGKRIALSLFTCMMAASYLTPHAAFAAKDPDLAFYPSQKWKVENISQAGTNALKTCAVSNTFNNGFIVQIAGSSEGFINLNIDFRQPSFTQNKLYEVQYTVPGGATHTLPTKAFKDSLLVTDLRKQAQFSDALKESGVVDVKIQSNEFRLYLTGLSATLKDYNECIQPEAALTQAAAEIPAALMPETQIPEALLQDNIAPPPPMPTVIDLTAAAKDDVPAYTEKPKASLKPNFDRERYTDKLAQQMKQSDATPVAAAQAPVVESSPVKDIAATPAPVPAETATIEPEAGITQSASQTTKISGAVINTTRTVGGEVDLTQIAAPEASAQQTMQPALMPIEDTIEIAALDVVEPQAQQLAQIEPSAGVIPEPIDHDLVDMRNKIVELEHQLISLKKENSVLDTELKSTLKDAADERTSISSNNWDLERATMRYNEAELQISRLGRQLQSSKSQCEMEKSELKTMLFDPKLTDQQQLAKLSSLEEDIERTKTDLIVQKRTYEERIKLLEQQLNKQP